MSHITSSTSGNATLPLTCEPTDPPPPSSSSTLEGQVCKADGLHGQLGLYQVTSGGDVRYMTKEELDAHLQMCTADEGSVPASGSATSSSAASRPHEPPARPALAQHVAAHAGEASVFEEVVKGDLYEGRSTWTGTALNVGVGLVPIAGQIADARDTYAAAKNLWKEPSWGNAGLLGLAAVGWVPGLGDAVKGGAKVAKKAGAEAVQQGVEKTAVKLADKAPETPPGSALKAADNGSAGKTVNGSSNPGPGEALVGSSRRQMRDAAERQIAGDPNHPLRFLLDENGKFKKQAGLTHAELADRPDLVQMGHIESKKTGGKERLMLQGAWENQFNNVTIESSHKGGAVLDQPAVEIGGVAVDLKTAKFWEDNGFLKAGTVRDAPRIAP